MNFDQGQFYFDAPGRDAGWRRWREELDEKRRAFEARWGVVLGKRVTVSLENHAKPLMCMFEWLEPPKAERNAPPRLKLSGLEFGVGKSRASCRRSERFSENCMAGEFTRH